MRIERQIVAAAAMTFIIGLLFVPETRDRNIYVDD
jgi:hypothetical protein